LLFSTRCGADAGGVGDRFGLVASVEHFGLFTNGLAKFDEYYENGIIDRILTTNLVYQTPELLSRPYYINVDMSKYIALIIDNLNHDDSLSELLNPTKRINRLLEQYRSK
jgi:ribose-phosphate pyrophosphokinase